MIQKLCYTCKEKPAHNGSYCSDCTLAYGRLCREANQEKRSLYYRQRRISLWSRVVGLFGGQCQKCSYREYLSALCFHHVDKSSKLKSPALALEQGDLAELDKCVLLCMNCHQSYHAKDWQAVWRKRDGLGWEIAEVIEANKIAVQERSRR